MVWVCCLGLPVPGFTGEGFSTSMVMVGDESGSGVYTITPQGESKSQTTSLTCEAKLSLPICMYAAFWFGLHWWADGRGKCVHAGLKLFRIDTDISLLLCKETRQQKGGIYEPQ